ncbi:MAG: hypothetical protein LBC20_03220 [Planctomycetaceae bacterium]|jgi:hypothetical protein|nr:hypothetical protein [Planctomycetaceae bacterium]
MLRDGFDETVARELYARGEGVVVWVMLQLVALVRSTEYRTVLRSSSMLKITRTDGYSHKIKKLIGITIDVNLVQENNNISTIAHRLIYSNNIHPCSLKFSIALRSFSTVKFSSAAKQSRQ